MNRIMEADPNSEQSRKEYDYATTLDHVIPLSRGGLHTRKNVKTACFKCNWIGEGGGVAVQQ
jgi:5-methylcytosine-specific restriction endonuclease McrA